MKGSTHAALGLVATTLLYNVNFHKPSAALITIGAAAIGSYLPDVDHQNSTISNEVFRGSKAIGITMCVATIYLMYAGYLKSNIAATIFLGATIASLLTPHRSFSHSIIGMLIFAIAVNYAYPKALNPFMTGYMMHIIADIVSGGVSILYPLKKEHFGIGLIQTNSAIDSLLGTAGLVVFSLCTMANVINSMPVFKPIKLILHHFKIY